ncbi:hypothetical protein [Ligilactobacillus agilis]|uniref:hypothetical protein n=1 Tax=Ligilactobacillus agilis TaxID=1601 RepID=UPI0022DFE848|nr:hypothetical protein [Ligilactobacillus agilis]
MLSIAIIGYNIFGIGGTTRSNLNLMTEFKDKNYQLTYYNYTEFSKRDVLLLKRKFPDTAEVNFRFFPELYTFETKKKYDYIFITREDFFPLGKILRKAYPTANIIGEVHTPLALLKQDLDCLEYFSCLRVATDSIKQALIKKYHYERIYVQTVSLAHLNWKFTKQSANNNLLVHARFDDSQKDISYVLSLLNELITNQKQTQLKLYLDGTGPDLGKYKKYVKEHNLKNNVFINKRHLPQSYTAISTSYYETLGYSIVESIAQGHRVLAYYGDDDVVYENLADLPLITWINKNIAEDAPRVLAATSSQPTLAEFHESQLALDKLAGHYLDKFFNNTQLYQGLHFDTKKINTKDITDCRNLIEQRLGSPLAPWYVKLYRLLKTTPLKKILPR